MNLSQITTQIGAMLPETDNLPFVPLPKVDIDKGEVPCAVKLVFDLCSEQLYFGFHSQNKDERELHYFGNNSRASVQFYLARSLSDVKYLLGSVLNNLFLELEKNNMKDCNLACILQDLQKAKLYNQAKKSKEGSLASDKWRYLQDKDNVEFFSEKGISGFGVYKKDRLGKIQDITEKVIRTDAGIENPKEKITAVVPVIISLDGSEIYLADHLDYHLLVQKKRALEKEKDDEDYPLANMRTCHLCHKQKSNVASDKYLKKLLVRDGLNKIFTTTTINSARNIRRASYDDSYAVCQQCYGNLDKGGRYISLKLAGQIADESVFILPEGLQRAFDTYEFFPDVKRSVDFMFKAGDAKEWYEKVEEEAEEQLFTGGYTINLVFYRTDGTSISILDTLEDIPPLRMKEIMKRFGAWKDKMREQTRLGMTLGRVHRIVPVRSNKKGEQLNIKRVLDVYKALLLGHLLNPRFLFQYAVEAVDIGLSQKQKDVYRNLRLYSETQLDFYIKDMVMNYLALMQVLQETGVLSHSIFREDVRIMEQIFQNGKVHESIQRMEVFVQEQGFSDEARGLFYLGALLHRVALAQYSKGHKSKPILKKINFQGMKPRDIQRLFADLVEKLMQYRQMTAFTEALMCKYQAYYGSVVAGTGTGTAQDELLNIFFLLAGYSYMVGSKVPDVNKKEVQVQQGLMSEDDVGQENDDEENIE